MSAGLYPDVELVERWIAGSVSTGNIAQIFAAPCDLDVVGMYLYAVTAPGAATTATVNVNNFPTSQQGGSGTTVSAYNLWTAANVPSIVNTAHSNLSVVQTLTVIKPSPYALNYPLPGPSGTSGFVTAQQTALTTETPVTAPPVQYQFQMSGLVAPDNTYTDYNGNTGSSASYVHAGDILTFVVGGTAGSLANLEIVLYVIKH